MNELKKFKELYSHIGKLITSSLELDEVLEKIMDEVKNFFNPQNWSLLRLDPTSQELFFVIAEGIPKKVSETIRLKVGEGIAGFVAQTGQTLFVPDAKNDNRFSEKVDSFSGYQTKSILAVPIAFQEKVLGVIELINTRDGHAYSEEEVMVLETIADFSAIAFINSALYEQTCNLLFKDILTGAYNRTKLETLISEWKSGSHSTNAQKEEMLCVIIIDLNKFKEINDKIGHRGGDHLLKKVTQIFLKYLRLSDMLFRTGGDEFLIVIHTDQTETKGIHKRFESIFTAIERELPVPVSLSYGMAFGKPQDIDSLMHEADLTMYQMKKKENLQ